MHKKTLMYTSGHIDSRIGSDVQKISSASVTVNIKKFAMYSVIKFVVNELEHPDYDLSPFRYRDLHVSFIYCVICLLQYINSIHNLSVYNISQSLNSTTIRTMVAE